VARQYSFVVRAPQATRVSLVGDFNDWDAARTPMRRVGAESAVWTTAVPLAPGRYRYAFLADGSRWLADPAAPLARDEEFGPPSSVVTVGGS
jgi:1,4-alpha-glucan branching enzyme